MRYRISREMRALFHFIILIVFIALHPSAVAQYDYDTDSSVNIIPRWKRGDMHQLTIKSANTDSLYGHTRQSVATLICTFSVLDSDSTGASIQWIYKSVKLGTNDGPENALLSKMIGIPIVIKFSPQGLFKEITNTESLRPEVDRKLDTLIALSNDNNAKVQLRGAKQLISTQKGVELLLAKQAKFYFLSFGYAYSSNRITVNKMKMPNPLGGGPIDATEKISMSGVDHSTRRCSILTTKIVDGEALKVAIITYLTHIPQGPSPEEIAQITNIPLEFSERTLHDWDYFRGLPVHCQWTRVMNMGIFNTVLQTEIELNN